MKYLPVLMILMAGCGAPLQTAQTSPSQSEASLCAILVGIDVETRSIAVGPIAFRLSDVQHGQGVATFSEGHRIEAERVERRRSISMSAKRLDDGTLEFEATLENAGTKVLVLKPRSGEHALFAFPAEDNVLFLAAIENLISLK